MRLIPIVVGYVVAAGLAGAQPAQVTAPWTGFVFDPPTKSIRAVLGHPGAAWMGRPLYAGSAFASVAPNGRLALIVRDGGASVVRLSLDAEDPQPRAAALALPVIDRAAWSPDSTSLAVYSAAARSLQVVSVGAATLSVAKPLDVPGELSALAFQGRPRRIVASLRTDAGNGLYRLSPDASPVCLLPLDDSASLAVDQYRVLYAADRSAGSVYTIREIRGETVVAPVLDGLARPASIAAIQPQRLFVVEDGKHARIYDLSTRAAVWEAPLDTPAASLEPLAQPGFYSLGARTAAGTPLAVLNTRVPGVHFVPAGEER